MVKIREGFQAGQRFSAADHMFDDSTGKILACKMFKIPAEICRILNIASAPNRAVGFLKGKDNCSAKSLGIFRIRPRIAFAVPMYWVMDVTINILQTPYRALVSDLATKEQQIPMQVGQGGRCARQDIPSQHRRAKTGMESLMPQNQYN